MEKMTPDRRTSSESTIDNSDQLDDGRGADVDGKASRHRHRHTESNTAVDDITEALPSSRDASHLDPPACPEDNAPPPDAVQPGEPEAARTPLETFLIMFALCLALFLAALDATIVATATPAISNYFHSSAGYVWVGSAYLLGCAAIIPTWGKLSDIFGRKPVLLAVVTIFWIGSLLCAVSTSMGMLIASRAIQGVGGGGTIVLPNICISDLFSMRRRGLYFGVLGVVWALASAIGPILGGVFTQEVSWRWCFYVNLPTGGLALAILVFVLRLHNPRTPIREGLRAIDWLGNLLIIGGTLMLLLGLEFGGVAFPWRSATVVCLVVFGAVTIALFAAWQNLAAQYPLMPARLFRGRTNAAAYAASIFHSITFMSGGYWLPLYFQAVLGASSLLSGVYVLPYVLALSVISAATGLFIRKTGLYKLPMVCGLAVMTLGFGLFVDLGPTAVWAKIILFQIIAGIGVGPNFQSPLIAIQTNIHPRDIGSATSSFQFLRQIGASTSVVIGGVIFSNAIQSQQPTLLRELGPELASRLSGANAAANVFLVRSLDGHAGDVARAAYWTALQKMYIAYTAFGAAGLLCSFLVEQKTLSDDHQEHKTGLQSLRAEKRKQADSEKAVSSA